MLFSCNNDIDDVLTGNGVLPSVNNDTISGILTTENPSQVVHVGNTRIELSLEDLSATRAIGGGSAAPKGFYGPFYSQGTPVKIKSDLKMVIKSSKYGIAQGIYFCDVYKVSNSIMLPEDATVGKVGFPNPAGLKNYSDQTEGVNWMMSTTSNDQIYIDWWFYTIVVKFNLAGQTIGRVIPMDGAQIEVPYYYI